MAGDEKNPPENDEQPLSSESDIPQSPVAADVSPPVPTPELSEQMPFDELPEFEPLTPEIVEEEAIRGDFMLRWAAIFLALLFGFSKLSDTRTLVHVRSGEQMRASGFLPSRVDTFSFSAEGQPVSNVSWLFDHLLSILWSLGGENALTVFKAVMAAVIARILVNISVAGMPTWWNSICAVFAIVACSGDFVALTELITLLGMVLVLKMLHQYREGVAVGLTWKMPLLMAIWCNFDSRAWIGAFSVFLFALGTTIAGRRVAASASNTADSGVSGGRAWLLSGLCFAALLINPFPLNSLMSAMTMYSAEYPAMQDQRPLASGLARVSFDGRVDYYSMLRPDAFLLFDHTQISGLAVILMAAVTLLLSRSSKNAGFLAVLAGLTVLAVMAVHELPVAALAAAVIAGTSAQRWYQANYQLAYSVDVRELLFSRGGRALTVFAFAFLGFCVVAGRLPGNTPVGLGFEKDTRTTIDTLGKQLEEAGISPTAHILHTRIDQGDILIWHGRKSMIDSRLQPFGRPGNPDAVFTKHKMILTDLLTPAEVSVQSAGGDPVQEERIRKERVTLHEGAAKHLQELGITLVMPRLSPPGAPDYRSLQTLLGSPEWILVSLGPSAGLVQRVMPGMSDEQKLALVPKFGRIAFQDVKAIPANRADFAREPGFYQRFVYRERPSKDHHLRIAEHYLWISSGQLRSNEQLIMYLSLTTTAIRELNQSLYLNPQNSDAYRMLGLAYQQLDMFETTISGEVPDTGRQQMRYLQSVMAFHQALKGNPADSESWLALYQQYQRQSKTDLAKECLDRWLPMQEDRIDDVNIEAMVKELSEVQRQLQENIAQGELQLEEELAKLPETKEPAEKGMLISGLASSVAQSGLSRHALNLVRENESLITSNPIGRVLEGQLMLECGELEDGYTVLNQIGAIARDQKGDFGAGRWHLPAAVSQLCIADYAGAIDYWSQQLDEVEVAAKAPEAYQDLLLTLPLLAENALLPSAMLPQWPVSHLSGMIIPAKGISSARAEVRFLIAMCHIEDGNMQSARLILQAILSECGASPYRQLAAQYLVLIDEKSAEFINQNSLDEWEPFEFPGENQTPPAGSSPTAPGQTLPPGASSGAANPSGPPAAVNRLLP